MFERNNKWVKFAFWAALVALYYGFLFPEPEFPIYNYSDGVIFLALASNLLKFGIYSTNYATEVNWGYHATWPPLFPLMLAGVIALAGLSWFWIKIFIATLGLIVLYLLGRLFPNRSVGMWVVLITALNPAFFLFSHHYTAEIPYLLLVVSTLLAVQHAQLPLSALVAGLISTLAFFTRGYAVTLIPGGIIFFALQSVKPWRVRLMLMTCFCLPMIAGVIGWKLYTSHIISYYPLDDITRVYGSGGNLLTGIFDVSILDYIKRFYWHDGRYILHLTLPVLPLQTVLQTDYLFIPSAVLFCLAAIGWVTETRRQQHILNIWLPFAIAFLFVSHTPALRYWLTYLPFIFYYLLIGIQYISQKIKLILFYQIGVGAFVVTAAAGLMLYLINPDELRFRNQYCKNFRDTAIWISINLEPDSVVVTHDPRWIYILGQRTALKVENFERSNRTPQLNSAKHLYFLCPSETRQEEIPQSLLNACTAFNDRFSAIYSNEHMTLYKVVRDKPP